MQQTGYGYRIFGNIDSNYHYKYPFVQLRCLNTDCTHCFWIHTFKTSCRWKVNEIFFSYNSSPNDFSFADDTFRKYTWNCIGEMNNMTRVVYRILPLPSHLNKIYCNMVSCLQLITVTQSWVVWVVYFMTPSLSKWHLISSVLTIEIICFMSIDVIMDNVWLFLNKIMIVNDIYYLTQSQHITIILSPRVFLHSVWRSILWQVTKWHENSAC